MTMKKKLIVGLAVLMGVIFVAGVTAIAVSNFGTQSNPLATKSYVDNVASENILSSLNSAVSTKASELESKFNKQIEAFEAGEITGTPSSFEVITLSTNQVIRCGVGTEIIVRSGSATCYGNGPDFLLDTTAGTILTAAGDAMTNNHMYVVSIYNNGLRARSDGTVIMVSGTYTIYNNL